MSIKITTTGKLPAEKQYRGKCYNCGCAIACKRKDGKFYDDQRDGSFVQVSCPTPGCGHKISTYEVGK